MILRFLAIVYHHMCNGTHYFPDGFVDRKLKSIEGGELSFKNKGYIVYCQPI